MQIPAVAFFLAEFSGYRFGKNPRIGQVLKLQIIMTDKKNNFPVSIRQHNRIMFGQLFGNIFIPIAYITQKALPVSFRADLINGQDHDKIDGLLTVKPTNPA